MNKKATNKSRNKRYYSLFPKTLASCVEPLARSSIKSYGSSATYILTNWNEIVGPELSDICYPEKIFFPRSQKTDGTLTIVVENGHSTKITYMIPALIERISTFCGYKAVSKIIIGHSYTGSPQKKAPEKVTPLRKQDTQIVEEVADDDLKAALRSLADTMSGKK